MAGLSGANGHAYIGEDAVFNVRGTFFPGSDVFGTVNVYNGGSFGPPTGAAPATGPFHLIREGATLNQHQGAAVRRVLQIFGTWEVLPNRVVDANVIVETGGNLTISGRTRSVTVFNGGIAALEAGGHIDGMTFTQGLTLNARGTNDDAVFVMNGGIINVPAAAGSGHGPTVTMGANARFYMFNGEIQGPTAAQALLANGNAVALGEGSFFRMEGGQIHGASNRGIYNFGDNAVIEIAGGTIHSNGRGDMPINPPYFYGGGGVLIAGEGTTFNMTGGTIRNNTAPVGGGLYAVSFQNITISSAVVFEDNTATAGTAVNNALAAQFTNIAPGTVTYGNHAFNNHDINTNRIVMGEPAEITITGPAELLPKQYTQLSVNVYDANGSLISGEAVLWSITGNNDASTAITNNGLLTIGQGETIGNRHITVRATLTSNPSIYDELQVRIDRNITGDFAHAGFLTQARNRAGVPAPAPLMLSNVMDITDWFIPMPFMPAQAINNFAGIENFRSLEHLRLAGHGAGAGAGTPQNGLNGIDLSVLPNLVSFSNEHWQLSPTLGMQWIIIDNPSLESFAIEPSRLVELDTAQAPLLESLTVRRSPNLETINISQNPALENLILFSTPALSIVDTSNNVNLRSIHFTSAAGRQIDLANNINLESVQLAGEGLTGFNWPTLTGLTHLSLNNNIIADIDLSIFPNLEALDMASNQLTVLDISGNPKLETLNLNANQINHLEIGNNTALRQIVLTNNAMAQANFNFNEAPNLTALMMAHNNLTGLDVTGHPNLRYLNVINNDMAEPDDVIGWRENGMFLGNAHFVFFPQRGMTQTPPVISTQEIPTLTVGQPVHFVFENSGIIHPTWAPIWPSSNDIPAAATGLSLQPETGLLTGTPLPGSEGIWTFTIRANSHLGYYEKTFALHILPANQNTRQITFTTNSPNGQIAAFINGTQIQSGDFVPVGSDIQFIGMPNPGYRVQDWRLDFGAQPLGGTLDTNNTKALPTFTISRIAFDHHVTVTFSPLQDDMLRLYLDTLGNGTIYQVHALNDEFGTQVFVSLAGLDYIYVPFNTDLSFAAEAGAGYIFGSWDFVAAAFSNAAGNNAPNANPNRFNINFPSSLADDIKYAALTAIFIPAPTGGNLPSLPSRPTPEQPTSNPPTITITPDPTPNQPPNRPPATTQPPSITRPGSNPYNIPSIGTEGDDNLIIIQPDTGWVR